MLISSIMIPSKIISISPNVSCPFDRSSCHVRKLEESIELIWRRIMEKEKYEMKRCWFRFWLMMDSFFIVDYWWTRLYIDSIVCYRLVTSKYLFRQYTFTNHWCLPSQWKFLSYSIASNDEWLSSTTASALSGKRVRECSSRSFVLIDFLSEF